MPFLGLILRYDEWMFGARRVGGALVAPHQFDPPRPAPLSDGERGEHEEQQDRGNGYSRSRGCAASGLGGAGEVPGRSVRPRSKDELALELARGVEPARAGGSGLRSVPTIPVFLKEL
ncbi:hypothetical protein RCH11_002779 [Glaciihabitans sp. GrIS 2.15]|nr:hypothetical protein [Glaciihabitans sp. GrIS 2.15]